MTDMENQEARIALAIRVALVERGMGQKDLADAAGMSRSTMSHYMTGKRSMNMRTFIRIAEALGVSPSSLMRPRDR